MGYVLIAIVCFLGGGFATFLALNIKWRRLLELKKQLDTQASVNEQSLRDLQHSRHAFEQEKDNLHKAKHEFENRVVSFDELQNENGILKVDLRNLAIHFRKLQLDRDTQETTQTAINEKVDEIGRRYLKENVKWISSSLNANNYSACKNRLQDVIERCREIGLNVTQEDEVRYFADLKSEYELAVRAALEREEQARIKAQIREEQKLEREIQREQARLEREKALVENALAEALAAAADEHSSEVESLRARLAEFEAKERAMSQAQLTKAGFVYVISNIGSFGENVFKIGMTRRLEPMDRVRELGDASVPFPFDVHMMVSCDNAPALENALHKQLFRQQINKTNPRKEFFRVDLDTVVRIIREQHGEIEYVADAEALQYRQSLNMPVEDQAFIEHVFDEAEDDADQADEEGAPETFNASETQ